MAGVQSFFVLPDGPAWRQAALEGGALADPASFVKRLNEMLLSGAAK